MDKISLNLNSFIIFMCVLLKYLIEYSIDMYILYFLLFIILIFQFLRILKEFSNGSVIFKSFIFLILSIISVIVYKDVNLLITFVLAISLIKCDIKKFLKIFLVSSIIMFCFTIFLYFLGVLEDNFLLRMTSNGYVIRHSLGFTHPNSIFLFFIPIVLCAYLLFNNKKIFYLLFLVLSLVLYSLSLSRTGFYCIILLFILDSFKDKINYKKFICWLPFIFFMASYYFAIKYGISKSNSVNIFFSNRLYLWNKIIQNASMFTLFGSNVLLDLYLDNFYLAMVYRCGLYFVFLYYYMLIFGIKNIKNKKILVSILIFMIYGLAESNTLIGSVNFTLAFLLGSILQNDYEFGGNIDDKK